MKKFLLATVLLLSMTFVVGATPVKYNATIRKDTPPENGWVVLQKQDHQLVVALVDQGSGSITYTVKNVTNSDGKLIVEVEKNTPPFMTLDFVSWVLFLEICNSVQVEDVVIHLFNSTSSNSF